MPPLLLAMILLLRDKILCGEQTPGEEVGSLKWLGAKDCSSHESRFPAGIRCLHNSPLKALAGSDWGEMPNVA